jgi:hypothetical protein
VHLHKTRLHNAGIGPLCFWVFLLQAASTRASNFVPWYMSNAACGTGCCAAKLKPQPTQSS